MFSKIFFFGAEQNLEQLMFSIISLASNRFFVINVFVINIEKYFFIDVEKHFLLISRSISLCWKRFLFMLQKFYATWVSA